MAKNTGKVREKSGNFVSPEKWEPCLSGLCTWSTRSSVLLMMFGSESWREWFLYSSSKIPDPIGSGELSNKLRFIWSNTVQIVLIIRYSGISVPHANPCTQSGLSDQQDMMVVVTLRYVVEYRSVV